MLCSLVLLTSAAALVLGTGWVLRLPLPLALLAAGLVGAAATALWYHLRLVVPLAAMERVSRTMQVGDLGVTMPEVGVPVLRRLAEAVNSLTADFQEVLLLFAHLLRSAHGSTQLLQLHVAGESSSGSDRQRAADIIADIEQMQEMIHDFKYFRVRLENDAIVDTGVGGRGSRQAAPTGAPVRDATDRHGQAPPGRERGELQ